MRRAALGLVAVLAAPAAAHAAIAYSPLPGPSGAIRVARDDGTAPVRLPVRGTDPVVSPDGARVAYRAAGPAGRLRIIGLADRAVVAAPVACRAFPAWSPDGTRVACVVETSDADGVITGARLQVVDAATGAARLLVAAPGAEIAGTSWSPDGTRIAFSRGPLSRSTRNLFTVAADGGAAPVRIVRDAANPVWGPTRIAFSRTTSRRVRIGRSRTVAITSQVWTVNPNGGGGRRLTAYRPPHPLIEGPYAALWTRDGRTLVGSVGGTDYSQLVTIDARTGRIRGLTRGGERISYPVAVSADGRLVLYADGDVGGGGDLRTIGIGGRGGRVLVRGVGVASATADWRP